MSTTGRVVTSRSCSSAEHTAGARRAFTGAAALLVDLDGTLIDSDAASGRAWAAFAARHGLDPATVHHAVQGRPSRESVRRLAPDADPVREAQMLERAELGDHDGVVALSGAAAVLADPRPLAIVTSCSRALAGVRLNAAGLDVPEMVISGDDVRVGKPDPQGYRLAARRLGREPSECVVLEDAVAGVEAGRAAAMTVIGVGMTEPAAALTAAGAHWIVAGVHVLIGGC